VSLVRAIDMGWTRQKREMASNKVDVIDLSVVPSEVPKLFAWIAGFGLYSDHLTSLSLELVNRVLRDVGNDVVKKELDTSET
jgi:hypothetical protein